MSLGLGKRAMALALLGASLGMSSHFMPALTPPQLVSQRARQPVRHVGRGVVMAHGYASGPGWTAAQVKRMSKKRRNVARNKRACKGAR